LNPSANTDGLKHFTFVQTSYFNVASLNHRIKMKCRAQPADSWKVYSKPRAFTEHTRRDNFRWNCCSGTRVRSANAWNYRVYARTDATLPRAVETLLRRVDLPVPYPHSQGNELASVRVREMCAGYRVLTGITIYASYVQPKWLTEPKIYYTILTRAAHW